MEKIATFEQARCVVRRRYLTKIRHDRNSAINVPEHAMCVWRTISLVEHREALDSLTNRISRLSGRHRSYMQ